MFVTMVSASPYVFVLCIATTLIIPVPRNASRASRLAQVACGICAAAAIAAALAATLSGLWPGAGGLCGMAVASLGDPPTDWGQFDRARADWERVTAGV